MKGQTGLLSRGKERGAALGLGKDGVKFVSKSTPIHLGIYGFRFIRIGIISWLTLWLGFWLA